MSPTIFRKKGYLPGTNTLISVENVTPFGIWIYVNKTEYFLSYEDFPYFKDETLRSIQNVNLTHGVHLYWPDLDVDLEIDNLAFPDRYPLKSSCRKKAS